MYISSPTCANTMNVRMGPYLFEPGIPTYAEEETNWFGQKRICPRSAQPKREPYTQRGRAFSNPVPWLNACVCGVTDIACPRSWNACVFVQGVRSRSSIKLVRHDV